jgi:hypothetical protein
MGKRWDSMEKTQKPMDKGKHNTYIKIQRKILKAQINGKLGKIKY